MNDNKDNFIDLISIIGEPARAKMLYSLLITGKAQTAHELAMEADVSDTSASNHLNKLVKANLLKVEKQGRHKYFTFYNYNIAHAIEAMINIVDVVKTDYDIKPVGIKYCRTCYDHLAGWVGVCITQKLEEKGILERGEKDFKLTKNGYLWLEQHFGITADKLKTKNRLFAGKCLDWSERKIHLSGYLGALLLHIMIEKGWLRRVDFSRELSVTNIGKIEINKLFDVSI